MFASSLYTGTRGGWLINNAGKLLKQILEDFLYLAVDFFCGPSPLLIHCIASPDSFSLAFFFIVLVTLSPCALVLPHTKEYHKAQEYDQVINYLENIFFLKKISWGPMKVKLRHLWLRWS